MVRRDPRQQKACRRSAPGARGPARTAHLVELGRASFAKDVGWRVDHQLATPGWRRGRAASSSTRNRRRRNGYPITHRWW